MLIGVEVGSAVAVLRRRGGREEGCYGKEKGVGVGNLRLNGVRRETTEEMTSRCCGYGLTVCEPSLNERGGERHVRWPVL